MTKSEFIDYLNERSPFNVHNGLKIVELEDDRCTVEAELDRTALNPYGIAHGGFIYSACDVVSGVLASQGGRCVTQSGSMYYLRPCTGKLLRAEGKIVKSGRTVMLIETNVYDEKGAHCARGEFQIYLLDGKRE